jgi:hypothetical protein
MLGRIMKSRAGDKSIVLATLVTISVLAVSHASDDPALDRCVQIFVKEVVPADRPVEIERDVILASTNAISGPRSSVKLIARGEKDARLLGRASCVLDRNGSIIAMYLYDPNPGSARDDRKEVLENNVDARAQSSAAK